MKITLNDGTEMLTNGSNAANGMLYIALADPISVPEAVAIFADVQKTQTIRAISWSPTEQTYSGYTSLQGVMIDTYTHKTQIYLARESE